MNAKAKVMASLGALLLVAALLGVGLWLRGRDGSSAAASSPPSRVQAVRLASDSERDPTALPATVAGVIRTGDGRPASGALVTLTRASGSGAQNAQASGREAPASVPNALATTSPRGTFEIREIPPGAYVLGAAAAASAPGYKELGELAPGSRLTVELILGRGGLLLSGRVLDVSGGAIPGATVRALESGGAGGGTARLPRLLQTTADGRGSYRLPLATGRYTLIAEADGYASAVDVVYLTREARRDLTLMPASRVVGRIVEKGSRQPAPAYP